MNRITLNAATAHELATASGPVELLDPQGAAVGVFYPSACPGDIPISADEVRRRIQQGGGRPLSEIWADLEKRA